jgi:hypothetical protein
MNHHEPDPLAILVTVVLDEEDFDSLNYPWIVGPFPIGTNIDALRLFCDDIFDSLSRRYPEHTEITAEVVSMTPHETLLDVERLTDLIVKEHRWLDPELSDYFDDHFVREVLDSIETDEVDL